MANVEVIETQKFNIAVAEEILLAISDSLYDKDRCSLVLAGGKTPAAIYRLLSLPPKVKEMQWEKIQFYWGDERFVAPDDQLSNYGMACETLFAGIDVEDLPYVYRIDTSFATAEESAKAYESVIRQNVPLNERGDPKFDLVLLGIGRDGHTASIFPKSPAISSENLCTSVSKQFSGDVDRITLTPRALFSASAKVFFIACGSAKADIVKKVVEDAVVSVEECPAVVWRKFSTPTTFFIDTQAAEHLSNV